MGKGIIVFNKQSSEDYGIVVETAPNYETPERDFNLVHVPGRNGDLSFDSGSYRNVSRTYKIAIGSYKEQFTTMANRISEWLNSANGYARLEDSYERDYFRLALYKDELDIQNVLRHAGRVTISFNCKPQRFLKQGEQTIIFNQLGKLRNPTNFMAKPLITIRGIGSGQFSLGGYICMISDIGTYTTIDSDIQDVYKGTENRNQYITLPDGFPKLGKGENEISFSGGITSMEVVPRWWTI